MKRTTTIKELFAPGAWGLGGAVGRAAMTLLVMMLMATAMWAQGYNYIDADGTMHNTTTDGITVTEINSTNKLATLSAGWYVVTESVFYTQTVTLEGDVHLILCDEAEMNISDATQGLVGAYADLTIYSQSQASGMGKFTVNITGSYPFYAIAVNNFTVNGGEISVETTSNLGVYALQNVTINGGNVSAIGDTGIIAPTGNITLSWRNASDRIYTSSYGGSVNIASGKAFTDGTNIYSGSGVTGIDGKTLQPAVAVTLNDGITATSDLIESGNNKYAKVGATVTVSTGSVTVPDGYTLSGITVTPAVTVADLGNGSYSFTVPAADVSVNADLTLLSNSIIYIDEKGKENTLNEGEYTVLTDGGAAELSAGWYVVDSKITYDGTVILDGDVHLVLCDGAEMKISVNGTQGLIGANANLTVYSQTLGSNMGKLTVSVTGIFDYNAPYGFIVKNLTVNGGVISVDANQWPIAISTTQDITINDGTVTATGATNSFFASQSVTINGGSVMATGTTYGISTNSGTITLSWRNASDRIYANSYGGTVNIASGNAFTDGTDIYSGSGVTGIDDKTLMGVVVLEDAAENDVAALDGKHTNVALNGRTLYKDGAWNTLCLPFDVTIADSPLKGDGVEVRTLSSSDFDDGTLTLTFTDAGDVTTMEAGKPYIIRWEKPSGYDAAPSNFDITDPVFTGVTVSSTAAATETAGSDWVDFCGTYSPQVIYEDDTEKHNLYLGSGNTLYYPTAEGFQLKSCRGWFQLKGGLTAGEPSSPNAVRAFSLNFDNESTGIVEITEPTPGPSPAWEGRSAAWYDLSGRRISVPSASSANSVLPKGVYINNGRKVVIK